MLDGWSPLSPAAGAAEQPFAGAPAFPSRLPDIAVPRWLIWGMGSLYFLSKATRAPSSPRSVNLTF